MTPIPHLYHMARKTMVKTGVPGRGGRETGTETDTLVKTAGNVTVIDTDMVDIEMIETIGQTGTDMTAQIDTLVKDSETIIDQIVDPVIGIGTMIAIETMTLTEMSVVIVIETEVETTTTDINTEAGIRGGNYVY